MHKKRYLLLIIVTMFFSINIVKSIEFPQKITAGFSGGITRYGYPLTTISSNVNNYNVKAFCTKWQREAPIPNTECRAVKWSNDSDDNKKASAAIGSIINSLRSSNGSMNWDNYFYAVFSINQFLYDEFKSGQSIGDKYNYAALPETAKNKIKPYVESAKKVYNNYGKETFDITSLSLDGKKSQLSVGDPGTRNGSLVKINTNSSSNSYVISAVMKCYESGEYKGNAWSYSNQIVCDNPSVSGIKIGNTLISNENVKVTTTRNGKDSIISITIPRNNNIDSIINSSDNISMRFYNKKKYYYAQNYSCGSNYQTVSPNYIVTSYGESKGLTVSFGIEKNTSGGNKCEDKISSNYSDNYSYYKYLSDVDKKKLGKVLDIDDPACESTNFNSNPSCSQTAFTYQWINTYKNSVGNDVYVFCRTNMTFDNLTYDKKEASKGDLLYSSDDGIFGQAIINYECKTSQSILPKTFESIYQLIPKVSLTTNFGNGDQVTVLKADAEDVDFVADDNNKKPCTIFDNNEFLCNVEEINEIYILKFSAQINYKYDEDNKYMVSSDGSLTKWQSGNKVYGYGILVPDDVKEENFERNATLTIDRKNKSNSFTVFYTSGLEENEPINAECDYKIIPSTDTSYKKEVLYRTIDVNNPFNKYNGESRYTGGNWCYYENNSDNDTGNEQIVEDTNISDEISTEEVGETDNNTNEGNTSNNAKYCKGDNKLVETYIKNRPNANSKETPLYSFKLTPANIKSIRNYNKEQVSSNASNEAKSAFVSELRNYATLQKSLCDISERCNIDDIIKKNYNKEES